MRKLTAFTIVCVAITVAAAMPTNALAAPAPGYLDSNPICPANAAGLTGMSLHGGAPARMLAGAIASHHSAG